MTESAITTRLSNVKERLQRIVDAHGRLILQEWEIKSASNFIRQAEKLIRENELEIADDYMTDAQKYLSIFEERVRNEWGELKERGRIIQANFHRFETHSLFKSVTGNSIEETLAKAEQYCQKQDFHNYKKTVNKLKDLFLRFQHQTSVATLFDVFSIQDLRAKQWKDKGLECIRADKTKEALDYLSNLAYLSVQSQQIDIEEKSTFWYRYDLFRRFCKPYILEKDDLVKFRNMMQRLRRAIEREDSEDAKFLSLEIGEKFVRPLRCEVEVQEHTLFVKGTAHPGSRIQRYIVPDIGHAEVRTYEEGDYAFPPINIHSICYSISIHNETFSFIRSAYQEFEFDSRTQLVKEV